MNKTRNDDHLQKFLMISATYLGLNDRFVSDQSKHTSRAPAGQAFDTRQLSSQVVNMSISPE